MFARHAHCSASMDCIVFEYPLVQVDEPDNDASSAGNISKSAPSLAKEEDDALDSCQQEGDGPHSFNNRQEVPNSTDCHYSCGQQQLEFDLEDIELSINESNASHKTDRKLATLRQQVKDLSARLDKQQRCAELRERRLRTLYEEELESIESDYQKSIMYFLRQHREQNPQLFETHTSQATQVDPADLSGLSDGNDTTAEKACNTESQEKCEDFTRKEDEDVEDLETKTQQLCCQLDKLTSRVVSCSTDIGRITGNEANDEKDTRLTKAASLLTAKPGNKKTKSRRYRKRQKVCGSPKKEPKSKTLSTQSKVVAQAAIDEQKRKLEQKEPEASAEGLVRTSFGDTFLVPGHSPAPSDTEDDQGWQTVRPRRFKTNVHHNREAAETVETAPKLNDDSKIQPDLFYEVSSRPTTHANNKRRPLHK